MYYTSTAPPASRAADRPDQIDDALVAGARRALYAAVESIPPATTPSRHTRQALFAIPMTALCAGARSRSVPIEKLIIGIKLAWASMTEVRPRLGETAPDALSDAVSACIEAYFAAEEGGRAD